MYPATTSIGGQQRGHVAVGGHNLMTAVNWGRLRAVIMRAVLMRSVIMSAAAGIMSVMMMVAAGAVTPIAFLGVTRLTGRPGGPGTPQAVGGTGTVVAGEHLQ